MMEAWRWGEARGYRSSIGQGSEARLICGMHERTIVSERSSCGNRSGGIGGRTYKAVYCDTRARLSGGLGQRCATPDPV